MRPIAVTNPTRTPGSQLAAFPCCTNANDGAKVIWGGAPLPMASRSQFSPAKIIMNLRPCPKYPLIGVSISRRYAAAE